ncbi:MAG TPA: segregation/condensation protein A [Armatimonadota bacterium]|nr:segregation/condensation protein A [Armatimonadota bacterium]
MSIELAAQSGYTIKLPVFEGPLDLLLHLIREHKLDIYDIPIAEVTDQYLHYLSLMESLDLNIAGDFFVMAATLLEIKSRMLLPSPPAEEDEEAIDPRAELVERLLEYDRFKSAAESFHRLEDDRHEVFWRAANDLGDYDAPVIPLSLQAMDLLHALQKMLEEVGEGEEEVTSVERQKITLRMKMSEVWRKIRSASANGIGFLDLIGGPRTRFEIVMTFLALLELLRLGKIRIKQRTALGDILIRAAEES